MTRLRQVVEAAIASATVHRLKARSYDPELAERVAVATTAAGRAKAAQMIRARDPVRYGVEGTRAVRVPRRRKRSSSARP